MQAKNNNNLRLVVVFGSTGKQGGAVARLLLESGRYRVRAVTRDVSKDDAKRLTQLGAEVVEGDMSKREGLEHLLKGAHAVFSIQPAEVGAQEEIKQGKHVADAAKAAGIHHFIYTSVGGADRKTGIPFFDSKWHIEEHIRSLGLKYTILRPVFFMENFYHNRSDILDGTFRFPLPAHRKLQHISVDDIAAFALLALERPNEFLGKELEIAGDERTGHEMAELFSKDLGRKVQYEELPLDKVPQKEYREMYKWFNDHGYKANIHELRKLHPGLKTTEQWLRHTRFLENVPVTYQTQPTMTQQQKLPLHQQRV